MSFTDHSNQAHVGWYAAGHLFTLPFFARHLSYLLLENVTVIWPCLHMFRSASTNVRWCMSCLLHFSTHVIFSHLFHEVESFTCCPSLLDQFTIHCFLFPFGISPVDSRKMRLSQVSCLHSVNLTSTFSSFSPPLHVFIPRRCVSCVLLPFT